MAKALTTAGDDNKVLQKIPTAWKQTPMEFVQFLKDVRSEMHKVVVPSRKNVQATTTVVIVTVFVFGLYFFMIDFVLERAVKYLLQWLSS